MRFLGRLAVGILSASLISVAYRDGVGFWLAVFLGGLGCYGLMMVGEDSYKHRNGL